MGGQTFPFTTCLMGDSTIQPGRGASASRDNRYVRDILLYFSALRRTKSTLVHGSEKFAERLRAEANVAKKKDAARWRFETEGQLARFPSVSNRERTTSFGNNSTSSVPAYGYKKPSRKLSKAVNNHDKGWHYYYDNEAFSGPFLNKEIPKVLKKSTAPESQRKVRQVATKDLKSGKGIRNVVFVSQYYVCLKCFSTSRKQ